MGTGSFREGAHVRGGSGQMHGINGFRSSVLREC